jgi:ParB family chromosome partitioning protein
MKSNLNKVELHSYDDLFGTAPVMAQEEIIRVKISDLHDFKDHPFRVEEDDEMMVLVESIKDRGVLVPGLVRPRKAGGYEVISGHRRKQGSILAGKEEMLVICRNLTDDDATVIMVDSNIQRENLLPSEKAFAYRMKMEALKHQGKKGVDTAKGIGEKAGDNARKVQRYIRLTYLHPELLEAVDNKKIPVIAGSELSFLKMEEQSWIVDAIHNSGKFPTGAIADQLKEYGKNGELTKAIVELLIMGEAQKSVKVTIKQERIREYFPDSYSKQKIEEIIFSLLDDWKAAQAAK